MNTTKLYTTTEVAAAVGRHPGHIKNVANWNNIGTLITPRTRVYSSDDLEKIRAICTGKSGRKKRDPNAPIPE